MFFLNEKQFHNSSWVSVSGRHIFPENKASAFPFQTFGLQTVERETAAQMEQGNLPDQPGYGLIPDFYEAKLREKQRTVKIAVSTSPNYTFRMIKSSIKPP